MSMRDPLRKIRLSERCSQLKKVGSLKLRSAENRYYVELKGGKGEDSSVIDIAHSIRAIKERIAIAAEICGRAPEEITLLTVSKSFPKESIVQAVAAGVRRFGENRVQEAEGKISLLDLSLELEWHLIGHLQSNKTKKAAELFDMIHSIDSISAAGKLNQASQDIGKIMPVLLQVNLGGEATKAGVDSTQIRELVEAFSNFKNLRLDGLMAIPPYFENPEGARPYFAELWRLGEALESEQRGCLGRRHLSMGMSHDFEVAIQEGATIVRIGTAIFGSR
jgi:PLP dependent protein